MARTELIRDKQVDVILSQETETGIKKIVGKVAADVLQVSGTKFCIQEAGILSSQAIIVATSGSGALADGLETRIPSLRELRGKREAYGFYLTDAPLLGIEQGLVIYGSDKLGTIYGLFHLSELLGVTAWGFWGDVTSKSYQKVILDEGITEIREEDVRWVQVENGNSKEPSVKYRGFFINDEWPCFGNWTFSHYQGFTAEMYDKVFEYLLRMKGNYLWPAMWSSSFLLDGPGMASMELADEYGIYIGMSHHEPCMRSSEEWDLLKGEDTPYGTEWDYVTNKEGLLNYWEDGLKRSIGHQVLPTIGMRGERESMMLGEDSTIEENVGLLKEIIRNQRKLIAKHINPDPSKVPQLFAVYKEVEDFYFGGGQGEGIRGFQELDDVTLLLCEDNFGNMRALPQKEERERKGGFGMYYHLDYHGGPISYEWVNSTPLTKIWEQMTQAYEYGVRELWIVNVGDLKFQEYPLGYFMELAYDFESWGSSKANTTGFYTDQWIKSQFGDFTTLEQQQEIAWVLQESVRLNGLRRPEACNDRIYHPAHYFEGQRMLERCEKLEERNETLLKQLNGQGCGDGYYSMIYYTVAASANLLKMHLYAGMNHLYGAQGKAVANEYGDLLDRSMDKDQSLSEAFKTFQNGKWSGMEQAFHIGFTNWNSEGWQYPVRHVIRLPKEPRLVVSRADEEEYYTNQYFPKPLEITDFMDPGVSEVVVQIANGGQGWLEWRIEGDCDFLELSQREGRTKTQDQITLKVIWDKLPTEQERSHTLQIRSGIEMVPLVVKVKRKEIREVAEGTFLGNRGVFVMDAIDYISKEDGVYEGNSAGFQLLEDYGKFESGMKVMPVTASFEDVKGAPSLNYQLHVETAGSYRLNLHVSPANPLTYGGGLSVGIAINGGEMNRISIVGPEYRGGDNNCREWEEAVLNQEHVCGTMVVLSKGINQITIYGQEPGVVMERLVLYPEGHGLKDSYLGPGRSFQVGKILL
ncbi:MAG TPA: glycosyl hydrolase 115 family protein [Candidatus Pelethocola excrementipullorum]|nr:glycosyl hydrolase 115 family protein [Candidatus Pelethocola excrementipullorum]